MASTSEQPIYGNYRGYYQTRRAAPRDERIALLPIDFFQGKEVLDIGCNEGWVTCEIAQRHGASRVLGVDIDSSLVATAWKRRRYLWSLSKSSSQSINPSSTSATPSSSSSVPVATIGKKRKRKNAAGEGNSDPAKLADLVRNKQEDSWNHFPLSMQHLFGPLIIPPSNTTPSSSTGIEGTTVPNRIVTSTATSVFPYNVSFRTEDWLASEPRPERYNVILALSITKWIHLHHGDDGLLSFFRRVFESLKSGCGATLVLEPQHWEGYAKAKRMDARLKENARSLKIKPEDFEEHLVQIGFEPPQKLGSVGQGGLRRPVDVYNKP